MDEYCAFDRSVPPDADKTWNDAKAAAAEQREKAFRDYFNTVASSAGVADKIALGGPSVGFAPPRLVVFSDDATVKKIETASKGRIFISKVELH